MSEEVKTPTPAPQLTEAQLRERAAYKDFMDSIRYIEFKHKVKWTPSMGFGFRAVEPPVNGAAAPQVDAVQVPEAPFTAVPETGDSTG